MASETPLWTEDHMGEKNPSMAQLYVKSQKFKAERMDEPTWERP